MGRDNAKEFAFARGFGLANQGLDHNSELARAARIKTARNGRRSCAHAWLACKHGAVDSHQNLTIFIAWETSILAPRCPAGIGTGSPMGASNVTSARASANCMMDRGG